MDFKDRQVNKPMSHSIQRKIERSPEELARLKAIRERYQREKPSLADLHSAGAEFAPVGEVILLRCLAHELKEERERQKIPLEQLAVSIDMEPGFLEEVEAGSVRVLRLGVLCQIAHALGKNILCTLVERD